MLNHVVIENYRGIQRLEIEGLSRVNLLVGKNNSGKTSVLECIELLSSSWPLRVLYRIAYRRGEVLEFGDPSYREIDIKHFFYGHQLHQEAAFHIYQPIVDSPRLSCEIVERPLDESEQKRLFVERDESDDESTDSAAEDQLALLIKSTAVENGKPIPLSAQLGVSDRLVRTGRRPFPLESPESPVNVITTESLNSAEMAEMWDQIALTPAEDGVVEALRILEPSVERIAFLSGRSPYRTGGIVVKLKDVAERIPLGSFGDGVRRLLALSFAAVRSSGGVLLIDEIDTGLHYSVMADMWRVLVRTAQQLNVQVFATTHSQDCLDGLASLFESDPQLARFVTLQRIERDAERTTSYLADQIAHAARRHIEVR